MTRLTIAILAAALLGAAALSVAHAQPTAQLSPPSQLSPPAEPAPTGSISGRIVCAAQCRQGTLPSVIAVPTDTPQPFDRAVWRAHHSFLDLEDYFLLYGLADDD